METDPQSNRFKKRDRVRIDEGTFKDFVGVVDLVSDLNGRAVVMIKVPGVRGSTPVELEQRQLDPA
ncbi:MAG TPA: hypothetical protein VGY55_12190 [Pirellulales bacterium]|jgi:transcription antitermination factor NusG|nr:hypothetical protein [Pirellulales bacterium]